MAPSKSLLWLLAAIGLCMSSVSAQTDVPPLLYLLRLNVTDAKGAKLSGADVSLDGAIIGITDSDGEYFLARKPMSEFAGQKPRDHEPGWEQDRPEQSIGGQSAIALS
jgi:hypothetical protein